MTTSQLQAPAGWYPEPTHGVGQRYWSGYRWTEHVYVDGQQYTSPLPTTQVKKKTKIYWTNLLRIRTWFFAVSSAFVFSIALSMFGSPEVGSALFFPIMIAVGAFWMTQQMACSQCHSNLRVTRLDGDQEVCSRCGSPTDRALSK